MVLGNSLAIILPRNLFPTAPRGPNKDPVAVLRVTIMPRDPHVIYEFNLETQFINENGEGYLTNCHNSKPVDITINKVLEKRLR